MATVYVIAPVFNEAGNMPRLLADWRTLSARLLPDRFAGILVDDGSSDGTVAAAETHRAELPVTVLRLSPNQGPGTAFATAFEHIAPLLAQDDIVVTTEGDNTSRIDVLCTMVERLKREHLDIVLASPHAYGGGFSDTNAVRILLSHGGSAFVRTLMGLHGINTTSSFLRAHAATAVRALQARYGARIIERSGFESMVELLMKCAALQLSISEVAMKVDSSVRVGKSKMKLAKTIVGYVSLLKDRARWSEHARAPDTHQVKRDVIEPTTDAKGKWLGLLLVVLFCLSMLVTAYRSSEGYYSKNMVLTDTSYFLMSVGILLQGRDDFSLGHVLNAPTPLRSSDHGTEVYVLHNLSAWLLKAILPVRPSLAVVLNGLWLMTMAISLYLLVWERTRAWQVSALVTASYLVANPYLSTVLFGLTSLDPNLQAFMIGTSALSWVLLSRSFRNWKASIVAGLFLGCLVLARVYTLGIVVPAMLPFVAASLWTRSRAELRASLVGGSLAILAMLAVSGWWLFPRLEMLHLYTTQFKSAGILGRSGVTESALRWLDFFAEILEANAPVLCVLAWIFVERLWRREPELLRSANWSHLWVALCPLVVLTYLGTTFEPYGTLALFGVYLTLLFPFHAGAATILRHRGFAAALAVATAVTAFGFFSSLVEAHSQVAYDKKPLDAAIESIRRDAAQTHRNRVTVGLVQWGILHDAALVDALIFDAGMRITTPDYPATPRPGSPLVVEPMVLDCWVWDHRLHGDGAMTPALWVSQLTQRADYVIVLVADASQERKGGRWPPWVEASRLLLESPAFRVLSGPFSIPSDGKVLVLAGVATKRASAVRTSSGGRPSSSRQTIP